MVTHNKPEDKYLDLRKVVNVLRKNWYWLLISQVFFLGTAFLLGKIIPPTYEVLSSLYIKEQGGLEGQKAMEFLQSFQLFDQQRTFQNEILILESTPLVSEAVDQLDLEISYFESKKYLTREIYNESPFLVTYDSLHLQPVDVDFVIEFLEDGKFKIAASESNVKLVDYTKDKVYKTKNDFELEDVYFQSDNIENEKCKFRIYLKDAGELPLIVGNEYSFTFKSKGEVIAQLQDNLLVKAANPEVSVVAMTLNAHSSNKAIDFLTALTNIYLKKNLDRKNHYALNTINYINEQLEEISDSLSQAEIQLEQFRTGHQVINISSKVGRVYERFHQLEVERSSIERQYKYYEYLDEFFQENDDLSNLVVPSLMGISDQNLNELMRNLIILVNQRNELIRKNQEKSPYLKNIEVQIESLKRPIIENIKFSLSTLDRAIEDLTLQLSEMEQDIQMLPSTERQLVGFERKFQLNDAIYTFLLERRAEAQIAKTSNLPEHEIVEPAKLISQVYPNNKINYSIAVLLGLLFPLLLIVVFQFFDDRIKGEYSLDAYKDIPFLGSIINNPEKKEDVVANHPTAPISETFRTIRTNLLFYLKGERHKSILVTSSISGEGKSFVSLNLALSFAQLDKKVVLVGYDLRKSNQFRFLVNDYQTGLTSFYVKSNKLKEIIQPTQYENVDVIMPGQVPPNPMELIGNDATKDIFIYLRDRYDYIVIDSSPIGVVSDAYILMAHSDVNIFVLREKFSRKHIIDSVMEEVRDKQVSNICMTLNDSSMEGKKYRYDYYNKYNRAESK